MVHFDWDPEKAAANERKHKISFEEACSVFMDPEAIQFFDDDLSDAEDRFIMLGMSSFLRVPVVCHAVREPDEIVRILSARRATKRERRFYEGEP